ncbi:prephenate dehydrogenase [Neiella marina]|uniref:Prephenate dehydrogenase n=1 Tax=Neiella holothuriorum TaxID=2870530 RepID=A0ABS7ELR1_9GAMM|nr:prephenate dehydrogenase [Neiella holothuriorum]MBW8192551.1 prephenate dehydrogenase [Neiella holothuriorum]
MTAIDHQQVVIKLQEELKGLYRKCVDADNKLSQIRAQGMGKFSALFGEESPFDVQSKTFSDYLAETAADVAAFEQMSADDVEQWQDRLAKILTKLQAIHQLLAQFKKL